MPKGKTRDPEGRRDRLPLQSETERLFMTVSKEGHDRFKLMYPRPDALRMLVNAALRAAIERPDLCPWLRTAYGKHAANAARFRDNAKLEHPLRSIHRDDFVLEPDAVPLPEGTGE